MYYKDGVVLVISKVVGLRPQVFFAGCVHNIQSFFFYSTPKKKIGPDLMG
jgi:hypothetical protein